MSKMETKVCLICDKRFTDYIKREIKTCSPECAKQLRGQKITKWKVCDVCHEHKRTNEFTQGKTTCRHCTANIESRYKPPKTFVELFFERYNRYPQLVNNVNLNI